VSICAVGSVNCDPTTMFDCSHGAREKCVPLEKVCDETDDCGDSADETTELCANHSESPRFVSVTATKYLLLMDDGIELRWFALLQMLGLSE